MYIWKLGSQGIHVLFQYIWISATIVPVVQNLEPTPEVLTPLLNPTSSVC